MEQQKNKKSEKNVYDYIFHKYKMTTSTENDTVLKEYSHTLIFAAKNDYLTIFQLILKKFPQEINSSIFCKSFIEACDNASINIVKFILESQDDKFCDLLGKEELLYMLKFVYNYSSTARFEKESPKRTQKRENYQTVLNLLMEAFGHRDYVREWVPAKWTFEECFSDGECPVKRYAVEDEY